MLKKGMNRPEGTCKNTLIDRMRQTCRKGSRERRVAMVRNSVQSPRALRE